MTPNEVITAFCELSHKVAAKQFDWSIPVDCFCGHKLTNNFQFSWEVIDFIKKAVDAQITRETK